MGGDWYDAFSLPDGRLVLVVGDVMGKGVSAAAGMGRLRAALRNDSPDAGIVDANIAESAQLARPTG